MSSIALDDFIKLEGQKVGTSRWFEIDQSQIDNFADVTEDHQFIHLDEARAKAETPFGGTIAHGFLTLSLMVPLSEQVLPTISGQKMNVNYGLDKLRFLSPVPAGSRVRARFVLSDWTLRRPGEYMLSYEVTMEIEGAEKPALLAQWLVMTFV